MASSSPVVAGVDVGAPRKGFHGVALQGTRLAGQLRTADPAAVLAWCRMLGVVAVAVDAPCRWRGPSAPRAAETALARAGIACFLTPTEARARGHPFYTWMVAGAALYTALAADYPLLGDPARARRDRCAVETFPQAAACALAGRIVSARDKATIRPALLRARGLDVADLKSIDAVDAALCALAAADLCAGRATLYGDAADGFIAVPAGPRIPLAGSARRRKADATP